MYSFRWHDIHSTLFTSKSSLPPAVERNKLILYWKKQNPRINPSVWIIRGQTYRHDLQWENFHQRSSNLGGWGSRVRAAPEAGGRDEGWERLKERPFPWAGVSCPSGHLPLCDALDAALAPGCPAHLDYSKIRKKFLSGLRLVNFITSSEHSERLPFRIKGLRAGT